MAAGLSVMPENGGTGPDPAAFGPWLKRRRRELDLTQEGLAEATGYSVETVRKVEAGSLRPSKQLAMLLADVLELPASEQAAFVAWARSSGTPGAPLANVTAATTTATALVHGRDGSPRLPQPATTLVGREDELADLRGLFADPAVRLLTLTGPGGSGKTRLALALAAGLAGGFPDGVRFVPLADITDPALVLGAIGGSLDLREATGRSFLVTLQDYLRRKQLLLVLDNFEQVASAAPHVAELLAEAPGVNVLVTSRAALHVRGEREYPVDPLGLPPAAVLLRIQAGSAPALEELVAYPAIRLFVDRARDIRPDFALTNANAADITAICTAVDGLPLAIELAAARTRILSAAALSARLGRRLDLLAGGARDLPLRQQTLRAAIGWSYDLLLAPDQALFRALSVFAGGAALEAIEAVAGPPVADAAAGAGVPEPDLLTQIESLVDQNLLRRQEGPDGEPRFRMLATIREFAAEQLEALGEALPAHDRHRAWFHALAAEANLYLRGPDQVPWFERLELEHDNFRAALDWWERTEGGAAQGLALAAELAWFWMVRGHWSEGHDRLKALLARAPEPTVVRARALAGLAVMFYGQPQSEILDAATQALDVARLVGAQEAEASALMVLAILEPQRERALEMFEEARAIAEAHGDRYELAWVLVQYGIREYAGGETVRAEALYGQSLAIFRIVGDRVGSTEALNRLGDHAMRQGHYALARSRFEESLATCTALGQRAAIGTTHTWLGALSRMLGDYDLAHAHLDSAIAIARDLGDLSSVSWTETNVGELALGEGRTADAVAAFRESIALAQASGVYWEDPWAGNLLAQALTVEGNLDEAAAVLDEALAVTSAEDSSWMFAVAEGNRAWVELLRGDLAEARRLGAHSLQQKLVLNDRLGLVFALEWAACLAAAEGRLTLAGHLFGAADAGRVMLGTPVPANEAQLCAPAQAAIAMGLDAASLAAARAAGERLSLAEACAEALGAM
jgi:predicted ATPase/transcriptional regulator with XRE-family HTH domain